MADPRKSAEATKDALDAANARIDIGTGGRIEVFNGSLPTTCEDPDNAGPTLLVTLTFDTTKAFLAATDDNNNAKAVADTIVAGTVVGAGTQTAQFYRLKASAQTTTCEFQGDVSTTGAGTGDLQFDSTDFANGGTVSISQFEHYLAE